MNIETFSPESGRRIKEDNTVINIADILSLVYDETTGEIKTQASITPKINTTLIEGNLTLDGNAQQLDSDTESKVITVQSNPTNENYVYVGKSSSVSSTVHMAILTPGSSITFTVSNVNLIYVRGTATEKVCFGGEV